MSEVHTCPHCPFVDPSLVWLALHLRDEHLVPKLNSLQPTSEPSATSSTGNRPDDAATS